VQNSVAPTNGQNGCRARKLDVADVAQGKEAHTAHATIWPTYAVSGIDPTARTGSSTMRAGVRQISRHKAHDRQGEAARPDRLEHTAGVGTVGQHTSEVGVRAGR
jgi:hypothetical protein